MTTMKTVIDVTKDTKIKTKVETFRITLTTTTTVSMHPVTGILSYTNTYIHNAIWIPTLSETFIEE